MELLLKRIAKKPTYTIGRLYINGKYFCDTIEDKDRGLTSSMPLSAVKKAKVYGETAIPTGGYKVTLKVSSPKFSRKTFYKEVCNGYLPRLLDVKGFDGILVHCLTPDTEILTEYGWQNLASFKENTPTKCYSYNVDANKIELVDIDNFVEKDYKGKIYCNNGRRINYAVTDKHRMFVGSPKRDGGYKWGFRTADEVPVESKFLVASKKDGEELSYQQKVLYRLIMAVQADGYILNWSQKSSQVRFHFTKDRKINRVIDLVSELGCSYKKMVDSEGKTHITLDSDLSNLIAEIMNPQRLITNNKELPLELLNLKAEDMSDLLLEYLFWDGRYENYLKNNNNMIISSTNMNTLNILQAMAVMSGYRSYIKPDGSKNCFALVLYKNQDIITPSPETYSKEDYDGKVWCLSNVNTTLIIRKNNRPMIIGNCGNTDADSYGCIIIGENKVVGKVINSQATFRRLYPILKAASDRQEPITIEIK